ncbi:indole-3-glycerol phosphate synthase TrpC [Pelobacter propionicus]|uniref:Indole-3-glycerol phosphate synthase n=1 Tax=Pelobacter propionicus (strain DSM 2379 / NBRC 103807 / OttBd1) TaxID=338966 RepID=A1ALX2_PELPD|nr:indole-3-glycerol phosphate synthase TrpC [Pelobacter propionicus]ABK98342.1 indole-3-glycerol phosphate synthase [Pelobacter propionicus DSM 2379]
MNNTPDTLKKIVAHKYEELRDLKAHTALGELRVRARDMAPTHGFEAALRRKKGQGQTAIIAEVKKGSPSRGLIRADFDPLEIARIYETNGATCLSVLTDQHFFMGRLENLTRIRGEVDLPLLRKDFILDPFQIYEARCAGADAILLITAILELPQMIDYITLARDLSLDILLEVHDERELDVALRTDCTLIGVNNRNLRTFTTDLATTGRLASMLPPEHLLVAESGISTRADIERLAADGADAFLIGESLMRETDIGSQLRILLGNR